MGQMLAGRYRLTSVVANGTNGTLWHGVDEGTFRPVAVKILPPAGGNGAPGPDRLADLLRRARPALSALWHPGIVRLLDVVDAGGDRLALVTDFVPGTDLAQLLGSAPLAPRRAAELVAMMAEALQTAHRSGVVHGDLKPTNVLAETRAGGQPGTAAGGTVGAVRLTDFSVATLVRLARPGQRADSSPYAPPWLAGSGLPTPSCDVYALGVMLHELLTGGPLAAGWPTTADPSLREVVERCLAGDQSTPAAEEVADWLTELAPQLPANAPARQAGRPRRTGPGRTAGSPPARPGRTRVVMASAAAAAVVAAGVAAAVSASGLFSTASPDPVPPASQETTATGASGAPALPEGATAPTQEGGIEFVYHWFAVLSYAVQNGDPAALAGVTSPDCRDCNELVATIESARTGGGQLRGGTYLVRRVSTADFWSAEQAVYDATVDRSPRTTADGAGDTLATLGPLSFATCSVLLEWSDEQWWVREVLTPGCVA